MNTSHDLPRDLARAHEATPEHLRALQARLAAAAQAKDILDVIFHGILGESERAKRSPSGPDHIVSLG